MQTDSEITASDPIHHAGPTHATWSKGNVGEAFPGLFTPLSWDVVHRGTELGLREGFRLLGALARPEVRIPATVDESIDAVFHGRVVGNLDVMRAIADRIPGVTADKIEQQLLGTTRPGTRNNPTRRRYPIIAARMPVAVARAPRQTRLLRDRIDREWRTQVAAMPDAPMAEALAAWRARSDLFRDALAWHTVVSMIASGLYEQVEQLCRSVEGVGAGDLVTGYGGIDETRIAVGLWDVSRGQASVESLIAELGFHIADAGQLHARSWRENPQRLRDLAKRYANLPESSAPQRRLEVQRRSREGAEARLLAATPGARRGPVKLVLALTRRFIVSRELGKSGYLQAFDIVRAATRRIGELHAAAGVLAEPADVVYLTETELETPGSDAQPRMERRRAQRESHRDRALPYWWEGAPPVVEPEPEAVGPIIGIGASPGTVEALARVVADPENDDIESGEILVCATSDPSWMALFLPAAAVVIDIGGQVSHGAIAARELGIPCVVGTGSGTSRIRTGDLLHVDGATGVVQILRSST